MPSIAQSLAQAKDRLSALPQAEPRLEAELLLCHVLAKPRSHLFAWPERTLTAEQQTHLQALLERRLKGEPIAYLLGHREFWSLDLEVSPDTLIPRPDTELLVELALGRIPPEAAWTIADLGTGSGAIAAAVALGRPRCEAWATDASAPALAVAQRNFQRLGLLAEQADHPNRPGRVHTALGNWCAALPAGLRCHLILSNPPYIAQSDPHLQSGDLPWEPRSALAAGADGLDAIRRIAAEAPAHLHPGGRLLLEHGYDQGAAVSAILAAQGFAGIATHPDPAGHPRVSEGTWPA